MSAPDGHGPAALIVVLFHIFSNRIAAPRAGIDARLAATA